MKKPSHILPFSEENSSMNGQGCFGLVAAVAGGYQPLCWGCRSLLSAVGSQGGGVSPKAKNDGFWAVIKYYWEAEPKVGTPKQTGGWAAHALLDIMADSIR